MIVTQTVSFLCSEAQEKIQHLTSKAVMNREDAVMELRIYDSFLKYPSTPERLSQSWQTIKERKESRVNRKQILPNHFQVFLIIFPDTFLRANYS